jgi:hypothetical protein
LSSRRSIRNRQEPPKIGEAAQGADGRAARGRSVRKGELSVVERGWGQGEQVEIFAGAVSQVEAPEGCAARQEETPLALEKSLEEIALKRSEPARNRG